MIMGLPSAMAAVTLAPHKQDNGDNVMLYRRLAQACESRPAYVVHAGRMLAWTGWAAILFGVVRKSAAPSALGQFPLMFSGWWIPQDSTGFLLASAAVIGGLTLWASGKKLEHLDKRG